MFLFQLSGLVKSENIRYFCELMHEIIKVPICFLNRDGDVSFEYNEKALLNPLYSDKNELYRQLLPHHRKSGLPIFTTTRYMEIFFTIGVIRDQDLIGTLIAGPSIPAAVDAGTIDTLFKDFEIPLKKKNELLSYYQSLQVSDYKKLISTSILLYYLIYGEKLDSAVVIEKNALYEEINRKIQNTVDMELIKNRQSSVYHHTPAYEKLLLQYVKEGNREKLMDHLNKPANGESGKLSNNPLRNQKNLFICSTALITRAAMEGGVDSELALTISDSYIQRVEELNEINEIISLQYKMLYDFTDRVHHVKESHYSKAIYKCRNYIFNHLYENISLSQLSEITGMSCNYLSERFKKEVGISISEYIQKEKIEEAKKLLELSDSSIMDICISMNFYDQSYFTKIFKKFTGLTPKQYRNRNAALFT